MEVLPKLIGYGFTVFLIVLMICAALAAIKLTLNFILDKDDWS